ncbi:MAG: LamG-like jellyroll fold domain-containing protein [Ignavibacteria bacterium]|nr:LamG-like jellyroll fold domain-containing protein [Ignavibacteria bacterium]
MRRSISTILLFVLTVSISSVFAQGGNALNFDGINDYVNLSSSINLSGSSFTLEAWFNATTNIASSYSKRFVVSIGATSGGSNQQVNILLQGDGSQAYIKTGFYGSDLVYNWSYDANWHHVAFSYDASTNQGILYLDGANVASQVFSNDLSGSGAATIGTPAWNKGNEIFYGNIDEVRIWNTVRTATEISDNKNNISLSSGTSGLAAYYHFDQGTAGSDNSGISTLTDATSNSYNGTLTNFALAGTTSNWVAANNSALPVELTSFSASNIDEKVFLNWQTATEVNNYGFKVERSVILSEAKNLNADVGTSATLSASWKTLGFVQGHGNSNSPKSYSFEDASPLSGIVQYRLKQIDFDGKYEYSDVVEVNVDSPANFALNQNHPNPFNPETTISYKVQAESQVNLKVFDVLGREVVTLVDEYKQPGNYIATFNTRHLERSREIPSGIYFYNLIAGGFSSTKKMLLIK